MTSKTNPAEQAAIAEGQRLAVVSMIQQTPSANPRNELWVGRIRVPPGLWRKGNQFLFKEF